MTVNMDEHCAVLYYNQHKRCVFVLLYAEQTLRAVIRK